MRDFVWVATGRRSCCGCSTIPNVSGLFNVGTGKARSFADLAAAVYRALGKEPYIGYVDTPVEIRASYQYFTEARMDRLRAAGYDRPFATLEDGVGEYVSVTSPRPTAIADHGAAVSRLRSRSPSVSVGFAIRWYALAYIAGLIGGWRYLASSPRASPGR